MEEKAELP